MTHWQILYLWSIVKCLFKICLFLCWMVVLWSRDNTHIHIPSESLEFNSTSTHKGCIMPNEKSINRTFTGGNSLSLYHMSSMASLCAICMKSGLSWSAWHQHGPHRKPTNWTWGRGKSLPWKKHPTPPIPPGVHCTHWFSIAFHIWW